VGSGDEEAGGDFDVGVAGGEEVAGDLFHHEAVEGEVLVEGADDVVAEAPGVGADVVLFVAVGLAVADDVEPVAAPAFAVGGGGEEAVDERFVGVGGGVLEEGFDFGGGGGGGVGR
jgi:hypothetical protein